MDVGHNTLVGHAAIERADLPVRVYNGMGSVGGNHLRQERKERIQRNTPSTQLHKPKVFVLGLIPKDLQQPVGPPSPWSPINPVAVIQVGEGSLIWVARVAWVAWVGLIHWETLPSSSGLRSRWQHMVPRQEYHGGSVFPRKSTTDEKGQGKQQIKAGASSGHESQQPTKAHGSTMTEKKAGASSGHGSQQPANPMGVCVPQRGRHEFRAQISAACQSLQLFSPAGVQQPKIRQA
ncbi:hypothetical protein K438DRAFT_1862336 [Mycena galopus ATCC 62051]|nr:hypothetical protein K438DRAFT_1862336 [Mycena galopus ATCC 62051]